MLSAPPHSSPEIFNASVICHRLNCPWLSLLYHSMAPCIFSDKTFRLFCVQQLLPINDFAAVAATLEGRVLLVGTVSTGRAITLRKSLVGRSTPMGIAQLLRVAQFHILLPTGNVSGGGYIASTALLSVLRWATVVTCSACGAHSFALPDHEGGCRGSVMLRPQRPLPRACLSGCAGNVI